MARTRFRIGALILCSSGILAVLGTVAGCAGQEDDSPPSEADRIPDALFEPGPVILLRYRGGDAPPSSDEPSMVIHADGRVALGSTAFRRSGLKRLETTISREELRELLHFILVEQNLAEYDAERVRWDLAATRKADAKAPENPAPVELVIDADGKRIEARHEIDDLTRPNIALVVLQVAEVRNRLERLRNEIYAGGPEGIARYVAMANAAVLPGQRQATTIAEAWELADGERTVRVRPKPWIVVTIFEPVCGPSSITVNWIGP
ncbi:MAG: hypothetical protein WD069_22710 [Planctomycetales bacterium]